jgi:glycosyltransferase involved in cell wall biosynthesis
METKQATLVILSPGFPKDEADSTCLTSQQNFVKAVNKNFAAVHIIVLSFQYPFISTTYYWHGNRIIAFNGRNKGKFFRLLLWRKVFQQLKIIKKENNVIGLLSFWCGECALLGNRFAKKYNLKHYSWILGQDAKKENRYVSRIKPSAAGLIALSDFLADTFFSNHLIRPANIIPNGIDSSNFIRTGAARTIDILGVGSLIALKQFDIFIKIIKAVKNTYTGIKAVICGSGSEEKKLKLLIAQAGLEDNILLRGEIPHQEVLQLMQQSKILLHTSNYEGFSAGCLEALYAGCHVISFIQPMKKEIEHWHIAKDEADMFSISMHVLQDADCDHHPVSPYLIDDSAISVIKLFGYE